MINPLSTEQIDGLQLTIMAEGLYAIDEFEGYAPWKLEPGSFEAVEVDPGSYVAYWAENEYKIQFTPQH